MPTYARKHQLKDSLIYHIFNRSNAKVTIFNKGEDFTCFKNLLSEYSSRFNLKIYHWAIMPNHYHLLLEAERPESLSNIIAGLAKAYSCYHHRVYSVSGLLWQGRFKSQPVQKQRYLIACGRYIERNPVKAAMVNEAYEYPYSSAKFYIFGKSDGVTTEDPTFWEFGNDVNARRSGYTKFLHNFNHEEEKIFNDLEEPVGTKDFIGRLLKINGRLVPRARGRPVKRIVS